YLWVATAILLIIQIPVVLSLLTRLRGGWNRRVVLAAGLMLGVSIINAVLYSVGIGLQNVRYALPACVLVFAAIVWANLLWLGCSLPRTEWCPRRLVPDVQHPAGSAVVPESIEPPLPTTSKFHFSWTAAVYVPSRKRPA